MSQRKSENFVENTQMEESQVFRGNKWVNPTPSPAGNVIFNTAEHDKVSM